MPSVKLVGGDPRCTYLCAGLGLGHVLPVSGDAPPEKSVTSGRNAREDLPGSLIEVIDTLLI